MNHFWHCILYQIVFSKDGPAASVCLCLVSKIYLLGYLRVKCDIPQLNGRGLCSFPRSSL